MLYSNFPGEVAERIKATVSKTVVPVFRYRGFDSRPLRQPRPSFNPLG